jgi:hypothetical protein
MVNLKVLVTGLLIVASFFIVPFAVNAESGSVDVPASETKTVSLGNLITGAVVQYTWETDDNGDKVDFKITDGTNDYEEETRVYGVTGTFTVPSTATYQLHWFCDNWFDTANVEYSYTITLPDPDADLTVTYSFSENPCHQGNTTTLGVTIYNDWEDQVKIDKVGIHFDFHPENIYYFKENLDDIIASSQEVEYEFDIEVNTDVSLGMHIYDVLIYYEGRLSGEWVEDTWDGENQLDFSVIEIDRDFDDYPDSQDTFPDNPNEWKDTDSDDVGDNSDKFPNDVAASKDDDDDTYPDQWNLGKTGTDSTTGLNLDMFPNDPAAWKDTDVDGYPDSWCLGKSKSDSTTGLDLDAFPEDPAACNDADGDGYPDEWMAGMDESDSTTNLKIDAFPGNSSEWMDSDLDGFGDNIDAFPNDIAASEWNIGKEKGDSTTELKIDAYPYDLTRYKKEETSNLPIIIAIVAVIIVILLVGAIVVFVMMKKKGSDQVSPPPVTQTPVSQPKTETPPPAQKLPPTAETQPKPETPPSTPKLDVCPMCAKNLDFPQTPKYCPFCNNQILK